MNSRAPILVHGATGFTGTLVAETLAERRLPYAIAGRNPTKLAALAESLARRGAPPLERVVVDLARRETVRSAIEGRKIVLACAGPFVDVGEPVLAECARLGVHYVDTTGEQRFVIDMRRRHHADAEASGACIVPAMAFEIAPADWVSDLANERVGGEADEIRVFYANRGDAGYGAATTRGTKKSMLRMLSEREPMQYVDGALVVEAPAEHVASCTLPGGKTVAAVSFPSPEAAVVPMHTGAHTVRSFLVVGRRASKTVHRVRSFFPLLKRAVPILDRFVDRMAEGPDADGRAGSFTIVAEATKRGRVARVAIAGRDAYGLTAHLQSHAAERALAGTIVARGVVAPSVAFAPRDAIAALAGTGIRLIEDF